MRPCGGKVGHRVVQCLRCAAQDRHAGSLFEEGAGGCPSDPGAGAGDQNHLATVGVAGPRDHGSDSCSAASAALSTPAATAIPSIRPSSVSSCSMLIIMSGSTS